MSDREFDMNNPDDREAAMAEIERLDKLVNELEEVSTSVKDVSLIYFADENGAQINVQKGEHCLHYLKIEIQTDGNMKVYVCVNFDNGSEPCKITEIPLTISM